MKVMKHYPFHQILTSTTKQKECTMSGMELSDEQIREAVSKLRRPGTSMAELASVVGVSVERLEQALGVSDQDDLNSPKNGGPFWGEL